MIALQEKATLMTGGLFILEPVGIRPQLVRPLIGGSVSSRHRRKDEQRSQQLRGNGKDPLY
jgi:hypothetical protein